MRRWEEAIPAFDREVYERGGLGAPRPFGRHPALLIVDVVESWTGTKRQNVLEAIDEYRTACGESAWEALPRIQELLEACRAAGLPIVYTRGDPDEKATVGDSTKRAKQAEEIRRIHQAGISKLIAPRSGEFVLVKPKASAFFGTPLSTYLTQQGVDCLLVAGTSTSGCVQATVTDGHSHGYKVFVVEECVFDRSDFLHNVYLFNMNAKYADVISLEQALAHVRQSADEREPGAPVSS
ncbi:MAG: isochorismatase family protein [Chloroflexi bacterium]|nr:isochorismatase family protein [Chloroflexota bacterium]